MRWGAGGAATPKAGVVEGETRPASSRSAKSVSAEPCPLDQTARVLSLHDGAASACSAAGDGIATIRHLLSHGEPPPPAEVAPAPTEAPLPPAAATRGLRTRTVVLAVIAGLLAIPVASMAIGLALFDDVRQDAAIAAAALATSEATDGSLVDTSAVPAVTAAKDLSAVYAERFAAAAPAERDCLARAVYYEARGEEFEGKVAVAQVVLNRARSGRWPASICAVVRQGVERGRKCQFSFACFTWLARPHGEAWASAVEVAGQVVEGRAFLRELEHATHYHATSVDPVWRHGLEPLRTVGSHVFYRDPEGGPARPVAMATAPLASRTGASPETANAAAAPAKAAPTKKATRAASRGESDWRERLFAQ